MSDRLYIALIDDDAGVLDALRYYLARQSMRTSTFKAAREFLEALDRREQFDCVVSDVRMPGMSGLDLMKQLSDRGYTGPVILITGHGDVDMAVAAIKNGSFDFIDKPFDESRLLAPSAKGRREPVRPRARPPSSTNSKGASTTFRCGNARSWSLRWQAFQAKRSGSGSTSARRPSRTIAPG